MNPYTHQWKWDFRRLRIFWILWLALLVLTFLLRFHALVHLGPRADIEGLTATLFPIVIYLFGSLLVARLMFITPFAGSTAHWKTLPLHRRSLFLEKTIFILLLIWLPVMIGLVTFHALLLPNPGFLATTTFLYGTSTLAVFFLTALLAALSAGRPAFIGGIAGTIGLVALVAMGAGLLRHQFNFSPLINLGPGANSPAPLSDMSSGQTFEVALVLLALTALAAWFMGALKDRRNAAIAIAATGVVLLVTTNALWRVQFGSPDSLSHQNLTVEVLDKGQELTDAQVHLSPHLAVSLPHDQLVWASRYQWKVTKDRNKSSLGGGSGSGTGKFFIDQASRAYPPTTRVLSGDRHHHPDHLTGAERDDDPCTYSGSFSGVVFQWRRLGSIPVRKGAATSLPGTGRSTLTDIKDSGSSFKFTIASLHLSRLSNQERHRLQIHSPDALFAVLSDPEGQVAIFPDLNSHGGTQQRGPTGLNLSTSDFRFDKDSVRSALGRPATMDALSGFQIDLFELIPISRATASFQRSNWIPYPAPRRSENGEVEPTPTWTDAQLPPDPNAAQVDRYLDELLYGLPREVRGKQHQEIQQRFNALGAAHLDQLIARLPVAHYARDYTFRTIRKYVGKDHLPALLAALPNEPRIAGILHEHKLREFHWNQEALPILKERLRRHIPFDHGVAWQVVRIVAEDQDPATYDDLRWHFIHARTNHSTMIKPLSTCPGFPLDESIEAAWIRARSGLGGQVGDLCFHAVNLGAPEALRISISALLGAPNKQKLQVLDDAVDLPAGTDLLPWLHRNFQKLEFDPERQVFFLAN